MMQIAAIAVLMYVGMPTRGPFYDESPTVSGIASGNVDMNGFTIFDTPGDVTVNDALGVTGAVVLDSTLNAKGAISNSTGNVTVGDALDVGGNIIVTDPGTDANSYSITMQADNGGTVQSAQAQMIKDASTPYLQLVVTDQLGVPSTPFKLYKDLLSITGGIKGTYFSTNDADPADQATGINLGALENICWENHTPGTDKCLDGGTFNYLYFTGWAGLNLNDDVGLFFGTGGDAGFEYSTQQTPDTLVLGVSTDSRSVIISEVADRDTDLGHALQTNPTLFIHASDQTDTTKWGSLAHDGSNFIVDTDKGYVSMPDGAVAPSFSSSTSDPSDSGIFRCANNEACLTAESTPAGGDATLTYNSSNEWVSNVGIGAPFIRTSPSSGSGGKFLAGYYGSQFTLQSVTVANGITFWISAGDTMTIGGQTTTAGAPYMTAGTVEFVIDDKDARTRIPGDVGQTLTCAGGGSATLVTSGLIPDGAWLIGVTTRITTALTGSTGFSVGDGSDADLYGVQAAATLNATTSNADATANWANPQLSAGEVTLTFAGGNCTAGAIRVVPHFLTVAPPTSN